jgi:hypothetical protein
MNIQANKRWLPPPECMIYFYGEKKIRSLGGGQDDCRVSERLIRPRRRGQKEGGAHSDWRLQRGRASIDESDVRETNKNKP